MALPNRIQQTIDAARERVRRRRAPPEDPASFGAEQADEPGRVRRAAGAAAEGTKRAAKGIAERQEGRTVGNKRTVEESPEERATRSARAQPVMEATLAPFGGEEQPDRGAIALQRMVGGVDPEPGDSAQSTDRGAEDGFDMAEFASVGFDMDDGAERGADTSGGGGGFDLWGGEI
jgi:hypothetical protein